VTSPHPTPIAGDLDLSQNAFWEQPPARRHAAYAQLRAMQPPPFFESPESPFGTPERGYYALVRHADVAEASRNPELFCSASGATNIIDLPAEFNEYFGSMINMDDPRHARLRRIVSRAFTPNMIKKFEDDVQRTAAVIVDELLQTGPCDFVQHVSARLPLKIICEMAGIGDEHYAMVLKNTNIILSGADPEFISQDLNEAITQILTAGQELAGLVTGLAERRQDSPGDDLVSATPSWLRSSSCWWWPATRPPGPRSRTRWPCSPTIPTSASCYWPISRDGSARPSRRSFATSHR